MNTFYKQNISSNIEIVTLKEYIIKQTINVHLEAFRNNICGKLGGKYAKEFLLWFSKQNDGVAIVAKDSETVFGYTVGAPLGYEKRINRDLFFVVAGAILSRPQIWFRSRFIKAIFERLFVLLGRKDSGFTARDFPLPVMSLVGIGVSVNARKRGIGQALMKTFEVIASEKGMKTIRLSVYKDNVDACRLYDKCGWNLLESENSQVVYYYKIL